MVRTTINRLFYSVVLLPLKGNAVSLVGGKCRIDIQAKKREAVLQRTPVPGSAKEVCYLISIYERLYGTAVAARRGI